jgi:p-aminobenzoyl-glutamate transporter AbgT
VGGTFAGLPLGQFGSWALVLAICWWVTRRVLKGDLVARQQILDVQADRDHWRQAANESQAMAIKLGMSVEKLTSSVERLTASAETSNHALTEIQAAMARGQ